MVDGIGGEIKKSGGLIKNHRFLFLTNILLFTSVIWRVYKAYAGTVEIIKRNRYVVNGDFRNVSFISYRVAETSVKGNHKATG